MNLDDLKAKGFVQNADGSWSKPGHPVPVDTIETDRTEQAEARPLDGGKAKRGRSQGSVVVRVRMVAFRRRLLDPDGVAFAAKAITDSIAKELQIDDADPRVKWEWSQIETRGVEGVVVTIEEVNL